MLLKLKLHLFNTFNSNESFYFQDEFEFKKQPKDFWIKYGENGEKLGYINMIWEPK